MMEFRHISAQILFIVSALLISGCATLSKDECNTADWRAIGYEDGARGYTSQRISEHRQACAEYGVTANFEQYISGHNQGVRTYCVPNKGFSVGMQGSRYSGICPSDLEPNFLSAYQAGKKIHSMKAELKSVERDINQLVQEQNKWQDEIDHNESVIVADSTAPRLRRELLEQNRSLESLIEDKQYQIDELAAIASDLQYQIEGAVRRGWR